ncbi:hypothetical protein CONLIGDRAFT_553094, partial [Coniochaeta ligniaria NRRL 30616]
TATAIASPATAAPGSEAKKNIKALAVESGLAGDIASQASKSKAKTFYQEEDFPALDTPKTAPATVATPGAQQKSLPNKSGPVSSAPAQTSGPAHQGSKLDNKKPIPGTLNIAAATKVSQIKLVDSPKTAERSATEKSATDKDSAFPALPTPNTASISSPVTRTAPKTLRVVPTPKTELPSMTLPGYVRSATSLVRPETPGSEIISDSTSVVSAGVSLSRTSSPPPSRVGIAPVRNATKSQQRKARKEAVKKDTEAIATPKPEPEVEIAPIVGRKKKQKKEKTNASSNVTPTESRPETPVTKEPASAPVKEVKETKDVKDDSSAYRSTAHETMSLTEDKPPVRLDVKGKGKDAGDSANAGDSSSGSRLPAELPTPSSTFQKLIEEGEFQGALDKLSILKPIAGLNDKHRHDQPSTSLLAKDLLEKDLLEPQTKSIVNEEDQASLLGGKAVRKLVDGLRVMLTPYGDCVRNLSPEEENRFLELQERVAEAAASPAAFVSSRHEPGGGFSLIKGRAVPNGPPGYFPQGPGAYPQDPVNKIQREEAIYYINQYVLPRINLGTTGFPGSWKSAFPDGKVNLNAAAVTDKMAANLHTAASEFNSTMAPYMDTAAPELSYPAPSSADLSSAHHHSHNIASVLVNHLGGTWPDNQAPPSSSSSAVSQFASGPTTSGGPFGSVPLMSLEDAEQALAAARRETEKLEKALNQTIKKNRRLLALGG